MTSNVAPHLAQLRALWLDSDQIVLMWLGQSSFALRAGDTLLLLDPFLSPHPDRLVPPPFPAHQAGGVDAVLCTHEHLDHFDADAVRDIASASPEAQIVVPRPVVPLVTELGIAADRVIGVQPGDAIEVQDVTVYAVPAMHGIHVADAYSFGHELSDGMYRYLGYAVEAGSVRVYHAGDTIPYEGMEPLLQALHVDVALLPINGRDPTREARNIVGNLDHIEAVRLAAGIGADVLIPMHYDMFAANPGHPDRLVEFALRDHLELTVVVLGRERPFIYTKAHGRR
jgi:L-ascorbate metabolism protein UlaG (beta-lactamase superfamily)